MQGLMARAYGGRGAATTRRRTKRKAASNGKRRTTAKKASKLKFGSKAWRAKFMGKRKKR